MTLVIPYKKLPRSKLLDYEVEPFIEWTYEHIGEELLPMLGDPIMPPNAMVVFAARWHRQK